MVKTTYIDLPVGSEESFYKGLKPSDRFVFSTIRRNDSLLSRRRRIGCSQKSLLPQIAVLWAAFSDVQRTAWGTAAAEMNLTGWQLFVQDQSCRIINLMAGSATPVTTHQSWVGEIKISAPATEIKIAQYHPHTYYLYKKVVGSKSMYAPVKVTEAMGLPLKIGLSYKSNLTAEGADPYANFYAQIWSSYQGRDILTNLNISLDLSEDWQTVDITQTTVQGYFVGYTLFIHLHDLRGELYCDNIIAEHGAQNWARDPFCKQIAKTFNKQWFQIPQNWAAVTIPSGAEYDSIYKDF